MLKSGLFLSFAIGAAALGARAEETVPTAPLASGEQRVQSIESLDAVCDGGVLTLSASVTVNTAGWTHIRLKLGEATPTAISFDAVGTPPSGVAAQVIEHLRIASQVNASTGVAQVHVDAAGNALDADIVPAC